MKLKDLLEKYGEYEVDLKTVVGKTEIESVTIDLTKPKPKSVWELKDRDQYYYTNVRGEVKHCTWYEGCQCEREVGNAFLTEEEANKEVERRKVETLLLKHGGRRWFKCDSANWAIRYNQIKTSFEYGYANVTQYPSCIYFDTKGEAENAVKEIGEQRIIKALFEVR